MQLSYWEYSTWFKDVDIAIIGSGIVGLNCAIHLQKQHPKKKILVLEKGFLPHGASTKNAGFACFGSISEILADRKNHSDDEVLQLIEKRFKGLENLKNLLGEKNIGFQANGNYELFLKNSHLYEKCLDKIDEINQLIYPIFRTNIFEEKSTSFGFEGVENTCILNHLEGQIDTGKMMKNLLQLARSLGVTVINGITIQSVVPFAKKVKIQTNSFSFQAKKVCVATNGFAKDLLNLAVQPVRNQVIVSEVVPDLQWNTCFHIEEGYFYVRNVDQRILVGGGRHLAKEEESTSKFGLTDKIQFELKKLLHEVIYPQRKLKIDFQWSGILGTGNQKKPIIREIQPNIYVGVRLGGMGVAIGSLVGRDLAEITS